MVEMIKALVRIRGLLLALTVLPFLAVGHAQDITRLYSTTVLQQAAEVYRPNLSAMWNEDLVARLQPAERQRAGTLRLELPLVGLSRAPLEFYAAADADARRVVLPIASVKFIDDLMVAFAYFDRWKCGQGLVSDYTAALRWRPDMVPRPPLEALGVPQSALKDPYIDRVAMNALKSIVFFIAAHEYAHVMYGHEGYALLTAQQAQAHETEADLFALDVMRRIGVPPIAMAHFFLTAARLEASPGDFASPEAYERHLQQAATHPVSAARLHKVADSIQHNAGAFARLEPDSEAVRKSLDSLVPQLRRIADTLDDRQMRLYMVQRARRTDTATLAEACRP